MIIKIIFDTLSNGMAFWTAIMAIAIIVTALVAIVTLLNSGKRQRYEFASQLYEQFQTFHLEIWQAYNALSSEKYESLEAIKQNDMGIEHEAKALIIFLARLGSLMRKGILKFEEIDMYFNIFISDEEGMENLISNLGKIHKTISEETYINIKHLFDICRRAYGIESYRNIISSNFGRKIIRCVNEQMNI